MSEPFVGEIIMVGFNFAPRGWAFCDGQLLAIMQNQALFSLLGTIYGGDGRTTFGLPPLRGRIPLHAGTGPGLTNRRLGERSGQEQVSLNANQLPAHNHTLMASGSPADTPGPAGALLAEAPVYGPPATPPKQMSPQAMSNAGDGTTSIPHDNMQPFLAIRFCIALVGVYPSRS